MSFRWVAFLGVLALVGCAAEDAAQTSSDEALATRIAAMVESNLPSIDVSRDVELLDTGIYRPKKVTQRGPLDRETCLKGTMTLREACATLGLGLDACQVELAWLDLHGARACHVRIEVKQPSTPPVLVVIDVPAPPEEPPAPECGNGVIEAGEDCDDGNQEWWDGCAPTCYFEEFEGCETIVEREMLLGGVGLVPAAGWWSPAAQLMVQPDARAEGPVTALTCDLAREAAERSCGEILRTMFFAGSCRASTWFAQDRCTVRLDVGFARTAPDSGVFSTSLGGVLSFTLGR